MPAGLLRPSDPADKITERVPERKWWRGPFHDVIAGDREFWLQEELEKKLEDYDLSGKIERGHTIDELMRAWCGKVYVKEK